MTGGPRQHGGAIGTYVCALYDLPSITHVASPPRPHCSRPGMPSSPTHLLSSAVRSSSSESLMLGDVPAGPQPVCGVFSSTLSMGLPCGAPDRRLEEDLRL
jgi:hypothetical protein